MNCWSKGIYLVCIPHKGSPFFNPLECTVFSKMHEIYATEMAEKFRKASGMLTVSYRFVANSLVEQLQRQLLRGALKAGWRKSHLYTSDHDVLRKHVRRIPATPAPVTPIKTRARTLAQSQLDQAVPISPPQSTQQPSERHRTRQSQNETLEKPSDDERDLDSQRRPITVNEMSSEQRLARDSGFSRPRCHPQAPSHIRYHSVSSEDPESSTDGSEDDFYGDEEYQDDASRGSSAYEAARSQMTPVCDEASIAMEESPIFSQRSDSIPLPCEMSGGRQCSSGSSRTQSPQVASFVEIPCARHSSQSSWEGPNTPVKNQLPKPNPFLVQHQERVGGSLEVVYREHVQALSNPKTPESQRKVYEQTLLDLAPILCAAPISAAEALHRFAQMSYSRQNSSSPSRPHAARACQDAKIKKIPRTKRQEGHKNVHQNH
ncbi:hypothetical protein POX_f08397 [Penicillium oxalicum]|uniref:hypothetical protein n=1 Tax=Penicillium oxalicum TaxID=69781 RepID=UPI0020B844D9|nr:hypothetical protein POX_f08397 [Penicillium oxalicum]KAI2788014.1 hypothetical protein POX_f08397 [Penicillium oxalicum]